MKRSLKLLAIAALGFMASPSVQAADPYIQPSAVTVIGATGDFGTLSAGAAAAWDAGTLADQYTVYDGLFVQEGQQWNHDTWWWDQDPSVNPDPVETTITFDQPYKISQFIVQADDNDVYKLQYLDGVGSWQDAWTIPTAGGWGMITRDSGLLAPIVTDQLKFVAVSGDNLYAVSEIQAFGVPVPEPETYALMLAGLGILGLVSRRRV